jgi:hypothetical protein
MQRALDVKVNYLPPVKRFLRVCSAAQVRNRPLQSRFAVSHPTWSRTRRQCQHVGYVT